MRHVFYVTGTRADFGLMRSTLEQINNTPSLKLSVAITGMHLEHQFGETKREVFATRINSYVVDSCKEDGSRTSMSNAVGKQLQGFTDLFSKHNPSVILLLGDRGEMLAAAIAALYLNIPVVHIHGGELSGTVDESIRHAISKLSHFHFVATENSRCRLIKMGENPSNIYVTGAPGLDQILNIPLPDKQKLLSLLEIRDSLYLIALVFHPVVQDAELAGEQIKQVLIGLPKDGQIVILMPNADAGGHLIRDELNKFSLSASNVKIVTHLPREYYLALLAHCNVLVGNSSSGIIEAASFGTPVVNVGERQANRERNSNTLDVKINSEDISLAISCSLSKKENSKENVYGDGNAGTRICSLLTEIIIDQNTTRKCNAY